MNLNRTRLFIVWLGVAVGLVGQNDSFAQAPATDGDKVFVGYLFRKPDSINFELYTHLCHAFLVADKEGHVLPRTGVPDRGLVKEAHQADVRVILSLGGWGWDEQFAAITSQSAAEDRYVASVMQVVEENDYDGIDLDWEYPDTPEEVVNFERLARRFRERLDELGDEKGRHLTQTMAVSADPGTLKWLTNEILLETMDWVNVMTYDYAGRWTAYAGHHSPLFASSKPPGNARSSTEASMNYLVNDRGFPANRLAVGIPLYGRGFVASEPYGPKQDVSDVQVPRGSYNILHKLKNEDGWRRTWDAETQSPWLISPEGNIVIGYDDEESVSIKTEWAMKQGFRGVFFWQIGADLLPDGSNPLQQASQKKWKAGLPQSRN